METHGQIISGTRRKRLRRPLAAELEAFRARPCSRCQSFTSSEELVSYGGRALCLYCVELWNDDSRLHAQNVQLRAEAEAIRADLTLVVRQTAELLDDFGLL